MKNGVPLRWKSCPPRQSIEVERGQQQEVVREEVGKMVQCGAFTQTRECRVVSPVFCIPKRDGSWRLIHDLRQVNRCLAAPRFSLRGAKEASQVVRDSNWLVALDLKRGYQQVAMAPEARQYLGALWGNKVVTASVLPFGLSVSPYIFTRLTGWLARLIRKKTGLNTAVYIDDFLLGAKTEHELEKGVQQVRDLFGRLGVKLSEKTEQIPQKRVEYLGLVWDAGQKTVGISETRRREYRRRIKNLLRCPQTKRVWQQLVGKLLFMREVVGPTMRHVRSLLHTMRERRLPGELIRAEGEAREDLMWWLKKLTSSIASSVKLKPVTATITTDASQVGLGGVLDIWSPTFKKIQVEAQEGSQEIFGQGNGVKRAESKEIQLERLQTQEKTKKPERHINSKELEALLRTLEQHKDKLRGRRAIWFTDSVTARAAIAKQGTQALGTEAWTLTKEIVDLAQQHDISLFPVRVPGRLNCLADSLSRSDEERKVWEEALVRIVERWGPFQEDPYGFTGAPTSLADTAEWAKKRALLVPPVGKIGSALEMLKGVRGEPKEGPPSSWDNMAVIVTPLWPGTVWWPSLLELRYDWIPLGRLPHKGLEGWEERNRHPSPWTASLIPLRGNSGLQAQ